nr:plasmid pRiA4b ORF-3 family protein [uncultured Comamonas sp.]
MSKIRCSYQLHIQLSESKPAIWRRLVVADSTSLAQLHRTIQAAMGWDNRHGFAFEIAGQRYGQPNADLPEDPTMDARRYTLNQLLQGQALPVRYLYDLNAGWQLRIKLEACTPIGSPEALHSLPICLGGRNACPPENWSHGMPAFTEFVQAIQDKQHPGHQAALRLHPADFDAKLFDLPAAQARIHALQLLRPSTMPAVKPETAFL